MNRYYHHRYICDIIEELRKINETRNYSGMLGLLEEMQSVANRMEAALSYQKDLIEMKEEHSKLKKELKELKTQSNKMKKNRNGNKNS